MKIAITFLTIAALAPLASAQVAVDPCATGPASCATLIETHATSEMRLPNTAVDISVGVLANGKDMAEVQRNLTQQSNGLLAYLKSAQVDRLITSRVWFSPETRSDKSGDKTVGYTGNSSVSFRTTPEKAADILAGVLTHGANQIESTNFTPTEKEIADARQHLSEEATRNAVTQADAIAKAAGMHVVSIRRITVNNDQGVRPMPLNGRVLAMAKTAVDAPIDVEAGDQQLNLRVDITAAAAH